MPLVGKKRLLDEILLYIGRVVLEYTTTFTYSAKIGMPMLPAGLSRTSSSSSLHADEIENNSVAPPPYAEVAAHDTFGYDAAHRLSGIRRRHSFPELPEREPKRPALDQLRPALQSLSPEQRKAHALNLAGPYFFSIDEALMADAEWGGAHPLVANAAKSFVLARIETGDIPDMIGRATLKGATRVLEALNDLIDSGSPVDLKMPECLGEHTGAVRGLCAIEDGLVSVCEDYTVSVWRHVEGDWHCETLKGHSDIVTGVCRLGDGFATVSRDGSLRLWHYEAGEWHSDCLCSQNGDLAAVHSFGKNILTITGSGVAEVWEATPDGGWQRDILRMENVSAFCALGERFALGQSTGALTFWGKVSLVGTEQWLPQEVYTHSHGVAGICRIPNGLVSVANGEPISVWYLEEGDSHCQQIESGQSSIDTLLEVDEGFITVSNADGTAKIWSLRDATYQLQSTITLSTPVKSVAYLNNFLVTAGEGELGAYLYSTTSRTTPPAPVPVKQAAAPVNLEQALSAGRLGAAAQCWRAGERPSEYEFNDAVEFPNSILAKLDRGCGVAVRNAAGQTLMGAALARGDLKSAMEHLRLGGTCDVADVRLAREQEAWDVLAKMLNDLPWTRNIVSSLETWAWLHLMDASLAVKPLDAAILLCKYAPLSLANEPWMMMPMGQMLVSQAFHAGADAVALDLLVRGAPPLPRADCFDVALSEDVLEALEKCVAEVTAAGFDITESLKAASVHVQAALLPAVLRAHLPEAVNICRLALQSIGERAEASTVDIIADLAASDNPDARESARVALDAPLDFWQDYPWESLRRKPHAIEALAACGLHPMLVARASAAGTSPNWHPGSLAADASPLDKIGWVIQCAPRNYQEIGIGVFRDAPDPMPEILDHALANLWRGDFRIYYDGEAGYDAGGLLRDWLNRTTQRLCDPDRGLFMKAPGDEGIMGLRAASEFEWDETLEGETKPEQHERLLQVGRMCGKALVLGEPLGIRFSSALLKHLVGEVPTMVDLQQWDRQDAKSLTHLLELPAEVIPTLGLTFVTSISLFGENVEVPLVPGGESLAVTAENLQKYVDLRVQYTLQKSIARELAAFGKGVFDLVPHEMLMRFTAEELGQALAGTLVIDCEDWRRNSQVTRDGDVVNAPHPQIVEWFWEVLEELTQDEKLKLFQMTTSSSAPPLGGFARLNKPFTLALVADAGRLPAAHTCFNTLDLPPYADKETLKARLHWYIHESSGEFFLF